MVNAKGDNLNCHVVLPSPIYTLEDGNASLSIKTLNSLLLDSPLDIINNSNIGHFS